MKNISLVLNIVLLVAVGVLYFLHFSGGKTDSGTSSSSGIPSDLKIAFINTDSVLKHYDYLKVNQQQLEAKLQKSQQDFRNRAQGLQNEFASYQRNVGNMTLSQVKAVEEDLGKKQQNLQLYQQSLEQQMMEEQGKLQKELYERITVYLKKYGGDSGLQVVFKYDPSSDMLYGGEALDITTEVVKGLNESYKTEKVSGTKADTTAAKK